MSDIQPHERLLAELDRVSGLRARSGEDETYRMRRAALRAWQSRRLTHTHADLLANPRFHDAAQFFLTELYGPEDLSRHVEDVRRIVPAMKKMLPAAALETVADAIELDALSEDLDSAMVLALGARAANLTPATYGGAYRKVGRQVERERQIGLIEALGQSLDRLVKQKFIGAALRMMRRPAELAGLGALQGFLEHGYGAFHAIRGGSDFVALVAEREMNLSRALFSGDDSLLG